MKKSKGISKKGNLFMTRMWGVDPRKMCRKHLLGEHVEMHMLASSIDKGKSVKGFQETNLLDASKIEERHNLIVEEMISRGYNHKSPLIHSNNLEATPINIEESYQDLLSRCGECRLLSENSK